MLSLIRQAVYGIKELILSIVNCPAENKRICIALLLIYNNPKTDTNKFVYDIERLVSALPCGIPAFVTGDFNINILKKASITNKCLQVPDLITLLNIVYCSKFHLGMRIESSMWSL
jgi:hypothetical protein